MAERNKITPEERDKVRKLADQGRANLPRETVRRTGVEHGGTSTDGVSSGRTTPRQQPGTQGHTR